METFPFIEYQKEHSPRQWGQFHGEEYRDKIARLADIRRELMLERSPWLKSHLKESAREQWEMSLEFASDLGEELLGIVEGSGLTIEDIAIVNNYTDFRDLGADQGCSTLQVHRGEKIFVGQTWDMHRSAKDFVCLISIPGNPSMLALSLVGCVGMMGINTRRCFLGVNNITTLKARPGIFWPVLVRRALQEESRKAIVELIKTSQVTSGHNYLVADVTGESTGRSLPLPRPWHRT